MADNWQEMLAELRVAVKRENDYRDAAFLDITTSIGGIEIRQMTPRDWLILDGIGNPLLINELPSPARLAEFLWILSPQYQEHAPIRRFLFARRVRKLDYMQAVKACFKYLEVTFQDSPASSGFKSTPYASWCAHLVVDLAEIAPPEEIRRTPLRQLFQYRNVIRRKHNPDCPIHNPSDKIKGDYLRLENARQSLVKLLKKRCN